MTSLEPENFWQIAAHWEKDQSEIFVEFSGQIADAFKGTVVDVAGMTITFLDVRANEERSIDFNGSTIRFHSFPPLDAVRCFAALWEDESSMESVTCKLTELRVFGTPN